MLLKGVFIMKTDLILREPDLYFDSIHNELNNFLRDTIINPAFFHMRFLNYPHYFFLVLLFHNN